MSANSVRHVSQATGLVFNNRSVEHNCLWDSSHIENPERYTSSLKRIEDLNLIKRCVVLPPRPATKDELLLVHSEQHIKNIESTSRLDDAEELEKFASKYDSIYINNRTFDCALMSAGCTLELVSSIINRSIKNGLALVRPPGHHAMVHEPCGFCYFNNVAIAAKYAVDKCGLRRVLIVDWDVHHGQGTQQVFYDDPRVLYFSIHRYQNGEFWPHLRESNFDFVGNPPAQGFNINVPLNETGQGNAEYLAIFNNVLLPVAYDYNPDLVLISAGYDAALGCPEGQMTLFPQMYPHLLNTLSCLAGGRICVVFEGGYCLSSLSESVALTLRSLLGDPCPEIQPCTRVMDATRESVLNVISVHRPFWDSLKLQNIYDSANHDRSRKHTVRVKYAGNPNAGRTVFKTRDDYPVLPPEIILENEAKIKALIAKTDLSVPEYRTCLVINQDGDDSKCSVTTHMEATKSVLSFYEKLQGCELLSKCVYLQSGDCETSLNLMPYGSAVLKYQTGFDLSENMIENVKNCFQSIQLCQNKFMSILEPCEQLLHLIDAVATRKCTNGYYLANIPGHFPDSESPSGYCPFSAVAVAAKYLRAKYDTSKVMIVDLDVQGGTQQYFYDDKNVLYVSLHYQEGGDFHTTSPEAKVKQIGTGQGTGYTINIPFHHTILDGDVIAALFHVIMPVAYEFYPQFVLLSLKLDDASERSRLSASCLSIMTKMLGGLCNGKMVVISEGNLTSENGPDLAACCLSTLLGESIEYNKSFKTTTEGIETIRDVVKAVKSYWKCLAFDAELPDKFHTAIEPSNQSPINISQERRQSSDPVAIPKPDDIQSFILMDSMEDDMSTCFCVTPLEYCPHLELLQPIPSEGLNLQAPCQTCNDPQENWVCLHCYQVYCGRYINQHMIQHGVDMKHFLTLSFSDLSVWCYACEAYIHNDLLAPIKDHAHDKKFNLI